MFDLLSLATVSPEESKAADLVILNSLSFIPEVLLLFDNYETLSLYLDRDDSGRKGTADILSSCSNCENKSGLYDGFKDLNEMLVSSKNGNFKRTIKLK